MDCCGLIAAMRDLRLYLVLLSILRSVPHWKARCSILVEWLCGLPQYRARVQTLFSRLYWDRLFKCAPGRFEEMVQRATAALTLYLTAKQNGCFLVGGFVGCDTSGETVEFISETVDVEERQAVASLARRFAGAARETASEERRCIVVCVMGLPAEMSGQKKLL